MNLKEIKEMINLMNENKLTELEIEKNGLKVRLKKEGDVITKVVEQPAETSHQAPAGAVSPAAKTQQLVIAAPMVGTFYRAPSPDASAYVEVGQIVNPGDVVCIIEAMKLMNEIKSEIKGKVVDIPVENGQPVEFGHELFILEPVD